jgi:hypothetical protein
VTESHASAAKSTPSAAEVFAVAARRDAARAALLRAFLASGLIFMLGPGTLLGVLNLLQISGRESAGLISPAWIQAHGYAQVFGWIGSFMLGIGIYSVPSVNLRARAIEIGWATWVLWTLGVVMRWIANVYGWHWRILLPSSAALVLVAFLLFLYLASAHRSSSSSTAAAPGSNAWLAVVMAGTAGWVAALLLNMIITVSIARHSADPSVPHVVDQHILVLLTWGILAPFIWGFTARWMPVLLGLPPLRIPALLGAAIVNIAAVVCAFAGRPALAAGLAAGASVLAIAGLRLFEHSIHEPKTRGVHPRFPLFVRLAYVWLIVAACLGIAAVRWDTTGGFWGASRHAFTVGFTGAMVLAVGQRVLPGFAAHRALWSPRLMGISLTLLMVGCLLRVPCEVLAYEQYAAWAWHVLPFSGVIELGALGTFAVNLYVTLWT